VHLPLSVWHNGVRVGHCEAGEMHFSFFDLLQHVARTRAFTAGTILGSGTVSNADRARGVTCLAERRVREILDAGPGGKPRTPFMKAGDRIELEMLDAGARSVFGKIAQEVLP
jgi:fumarylacetoacetate (FAA) hydrolase